MPTSKTPKQLKIIVVDDSVIDREIAVAALQREDRFHVVAVARNGEDALAKLDAVGADALILDLSMPKMDGIELMERIRGAENVPGVIVVSASDRKDDRQRALEAGAMAYVLKPGAREGETPTSYRDALLSQLERLVAPLPSGSAASRSASSLMGSRNGATATASTSEVHHGPASERGGRPPAIVDAVVVGASTGGPDALHHFVSALPETFTTPLLITQHMPAGFTTQFAARLDQVTHLDFVEAQGGELVEPGRAFLAPGGMHLVLEHSGNDVVLRLDDGPPENSCKPAVDPMFRSAAEVFGPRIAALVFTGMGMDGLVGARVISDGGGWVMVQDEESSVVWGMPGYVARAGVADRIVPLERMAPELVRALGHGGSARR